MGIVLGLPQRFVESCAFQPPKPALYGADAEWIVEWEGTRIYADLRDAGPVVVYSHGNAEDLEIVRLHCAEPFVEHASFVAYEYAGYGPDPAVSPSEDAAIADLENTLAYLYSLGVTDQRIVLVGRSLGSGPTCRVAVEHPRVATVILISPFTSAMRTQVPYAIAGVDIFENYAYVPRLEMPLHVIHGLDDAIVPPSHGETLHELARTPGILTLIEGRGHNNLVCEEFHDALSDIFDGLGHSE